MEVFVYADWQGLNGPILMGTLFVTHTKGHHTVSFEYEKEWLRNGNAQTLDPDLQLYSGLQYLGTQKINFGLFMDSAPDRWGRALMDRREAILARKDHRKPKKLFEEDYLLGVYDAHRMGALRFKVAGNDNFQHQDTGLSAPPWTSLKELEHASLALENDLLKDTQALQWINLLIAPGASLGGARPKASVLDEHGDLWIAKFPSAKDTLDIGAWEMVARELAIKCNINVSVGMVHQYNNKHHTYLSKRFDRAGKRRIHFASAMTLLGKTDGAAASYLDLAEFIIRQGAAPNDDLEQLWRRIVFYIAIKNTDDHLRNHGFLLRDGGWRLSPAYDMNPVYFGTGLSLNISQTDNSLDHDVARQVAKYFRIPGKKAELVIASTVKTVKQWAALASRYGISSKEQQMMATAFDS